MRGRKNEEEGGRKTPVKLSSDIKLTRKMCRQTTIQFWEMDGMVDLYPSFSLSHFSLSLYHACHSLSTNTGAPAQKEQGNCRPLSESVLSRLYVPWHAMTVRICPAELLVDEWF